MAEMTMQGLVGGADGVTEHFLSTTYPAIADAVSAPLYYVAILYWALFGYQIYAGHAPMQWKDLLARAVMTVAVFATLQWGGFAQQLYHFFVSFMEGSAATIMAGEPTSNMIDSLFKNVDAAADKLRATASWHEIAIILNALLLFVVNCLLFIVALLYMLIAKFGLAINMVLAPLFIGFFMFTATRQWGMNWLSKMLYFCFIYILVIAIVRFGFVAFADTINMAEGLAAPGILATSKQITQLVIVESVLILLMLGVRGWASALSGGAMGSSGMLIMLARRMFGR